MDFSKKLLAGAVVFIAVFGLSFFLASHFLKFGLAQTSTPKITGTIVLSDDFKYFSVTDNLESLESQSGQVNSNVALPGDTENNCNVIVSGCCALAYLNEAPNLQGIMQVNLGSVTESTSNSYNAPHCLNASGTLLGGNVYEASVDCAGSFGEQKPRGVPSYLSVSYACDAPVP